MQMKITEKRGIEKGRRLPGMRERGCWADGGDGWEARWSCCMLLLLGAETPISVSSLLLVGLLLLSFSSFPASVSPSSLCFFFVCFLLSLYFFFFISPSLFSLCSPLFFFLPFCFSVVFIFSMVLFVSLETSLPYQYLLLLYNISLRSFTVFSSLFFPLFFSFLLLLCVFVLFFLHPFLSKISPLVLLSSPVFIDRRREQLPCLCPILETG